MTWRSLVGTICDVLTFLIVARALLSWFPLRHDNPIIVFLNRLTEPFMAPLRRVIPRIGMIDISPMVAIIILQLIKVFI